MPLPGFSQTPTVYAGTGLFCPKKAENRKKNMMQHQNQFQRASRNRFHYHRPLTA
jgi:hypothetical protein